MNINHMVVMALLLLFCLTVSTTIMAESIAKRNDNNEIWDVDTDDFNIPEEKNERFKKASKASFFKSLLNKRAEASAQHSALLQQCYSGDLYLTVKALGVFSNPGVSMGRVNGDLLSKLKTNKTMRMKKSTFESYQGNYEKFNDSNESNHKRRQITKRSVSELSKRGTDICEESAGVLIQLAHANGQLAYVVEEFDCEGSTCSWESINIGNCQQKIQTMVLYVLDEYDNFVPQTNEIGCGCECILY